MPEKLDHSHLWDNEIWGPQIFRQLARGGRGHHSFSLSLVLLLFQKLSQSLGQAKGNARGPFCTPPGALSLGGGRGSGETGPSSESAEETRGAGFLWGLQPQRPADRRVPPRQRRARRGGRDVGGGGAWEGEEGAGRGWAGEEGREEERQAGEERGGYRERRQKEAGQRRALAPKWEKGASEREGRGATAVEPSCPWAGALAAVVHGRPSAVILAARESGAQLARVSRSGAGLGRDGRTAAAGSPSARPPFPLSRARGPSAPPAEPCFPQVPGRCPR